MSNTPIEALIKVMEKFKWSVSSLNYMPTSHQLERWAMIILEGMSGPTRLYHSHDHVLELTEGADPVGTIAALFHDIIYYQVDGGVPPSLHSFIFPYFNSVNGILFTKEVEEPEFIYEIALEIFGFSQGQQLLAAKGQNEFLSALLALKVMSEVLSKKELLMVCVCIEATIPFRAHTNFVEVLEKRLNNVNIKHSLGIEPSELEAGIKRAVALANKDVESFSHQEVAYFLEETWMLLPETNGRLIASSMYTIREYRNALFKMERFLSNLKANSIYCHHAGTPSDEQVKQLTERAQRNIELGSYYLKIKLYSVGILEALSDITGGDVPLMFFMGDFRNATSSVPKMEAFLDRSKISLPEAQDKNPVISELLTTGRASDSVYDTKASPLAAFLYEFLGDKKILDSYLEAEKLFLGKLSAENFLLNQNQELVDTIAYACANVAYTRKTRLLSIRNILNRVSPQSA